MLHSTKLLNKVLITLMALLLLFNTNYGAFKTSEAHANVLAATFEEWAAATYAGVAVGVIALGAGAMHTQEYLLDNVDAMYQTAKETWPKMSADMKANFLSSVEKMEDGIITVGDWITGALDALKPKFGADTGTGSGSGYFIAKSGNGYAYLAVNDYNPTFPRLTYIDEDGKKDYARTSMVLRVRKYSSTVFYVDVIVDGFTRGSVYFYDKPTDFLSSLYEQSGNVKSLGDMLAFAASIGVNLGMYYPDGTTVTPGANTYNRLDDWIRERAIPNGQLGVYNPGAQAYTPDGYRLGLSSDGQTLLKLPDGIPWEGTADWKQPLLNTVDGTTAVLDTAVGSWIDVTTGKKIRDATVPEMASGTGVDESTAEYVLIKAKDEEKAREETGEYAGKPYEGDRNPDLDFRNRKGKCTLDKHANDHGNVSSDKYLHNARDFLEKPPTSTTQTFVSEEGTYFRYDSATNEFGIINKYGGISTYFKPDDKILYWLEQIRKYAPK
ncbi:hypothetical protein PVA17_12115 [Lysinibacillus sp. CNPSo 3705]|uniref:hypothetical protein n=1 Tax=Lysinibacillus sp. CNPSo 3705 TaxID=3028148 RepID=UPI0023637A69|nr:hypothetical protein [Lysinibacillus sp. CNPSo 3705]MDD1503502.1 hypothetical protein [Lysinibacillus sp. CNPSo 3705]